MYGDCLCSSMNCILLMLYNKNANVWAPVSIQSCKLQNLLLLQFIWYEDRTLQKYLVSAEVWSCWGDYEFNNYFSGNRLWIQGFGYVCLEWNAHFFPSILQITGSCTKGFVKLFRRTIWEKCHSWRNLCFPPSWPVGRFSLILLHTSYLLLWLVDSLAVCGFPVLLPGA